jgi:hypothetical protein
MAREVGSAIPQGQGGVTIRAFGGAWDRYRASVRVPWL